MSNPPPRFFLASFLSIWLPVDIDGGVFLSVSRIAQVVLKPSTKNGIKKIGVLNWSFWTPFRRILGHILHFEVLWFFPTSSYLPDYQPLAAVKCTLWLSTGDTTQPTTPASVKLSLDLVTKETIATSRKRRSISKLLPFHMSTGVYQLNPICLQVSQVSPLRNAGFFQLENAHMLCPLCNCVT